jgi:hypothetical protein
MVTAYFKIFVIHCKGLREISGRTPGPWPDFVLSLSQMEVGHVIDKLNVCVVAFYSLGIAY